MYQTQKTNLPYLAAAQAQKHVTVNEALRTLDILLQLNVLDKDLATPPLTPQAGDSYIVAAAATDAWTGHEHSLAAWIDNGWHFIVPRTGWQAYVEDEQLTYVFGGAEWSTTRIDEDQLNPVSRIGINAAADDANRLAVKSDAILFDHAGAGSQVKVNKAATSDTASLLFQNNYSARAEMGLAGTDDFHVKVSDNGVTFKNSLVINPVTGDVRFPTHSIDGFKKNYTYCDNSQLNNDHWYEVFRWDFTGNYIIMTLIADVTHRNSSAHHIIQLKAEFRETVAAQPYFTNLSLSVKGDVGFQDGESYLLVADDTDFTLRLYHKRASGHHPHRYATIRHMTGNPQNIGFTFTNVKVGVSDPIGNSFLKLTHISSS